MATFDVRAFWTPDRIKRAIKDATPAELPLCTKLGAPTFLRTSDNDSNQVAYPPLARPLVPDGVPQEAHQPPVDAMRQLVVQDAGQPRIRNPVLDVANRELTRFPYQSIGKLFVYGTEYDESNNTQKEDITKSATAFYIGKGEVLTVAHVFHLQSSTTKVFKETHGGIFIPGMLNASDTIGQNYGIFIISPGNYVLHPRYNPQQLENNDTAAEHDICRAFVGEGIKNNTDSEQYVDSIEDVHLQPLEVARDYNEQNFKDLEEDTWRVLGYPHLHAQGKLIGVGGLFQSYIESTKVTIHTPAEVLVGMSGGPWILDREITEGTCKVIGIQAGKRFYHELNMHVAESPYLSSGFLEQARPQL